MPSSISRYTPPPKSEQFPPNLFTFDGKRKYLNAEELERFIKAAQQQERPEVRTFCLVLAHTGCRISEALALTVDSVDLPSGAITFKTLKQRDRTARACKTCGKSR